jgi:hypothetical protein
MSSSSNDNKQDTVRSRGVDRTPASLTTCDVLIIPPRSIRYTIKSVCARWISSIFRPRHTTGSVIEIVVTRKVERTVDNPDDDWIEISSDAWSILTEVLEGLWDTDVATIDCSPTGSIELECETRPNEGETER